SEQIDPQIAYTAGLVCDLGKLVMAFVCPEVYPRVASRTRTVNCTWEEAEKEMLGYDHRAVTVQLLRSWRFPEEFVIAVEMQSRPHEAPAQAVPLMAQLHAAKYVAVSFGPGVTEGGFLFELHGAFLAEWGFTPEFLEEVMIEVKDRAARRLG